ncbi:MAG: PAS domain S-box protein, partial [Bacteroidetes bacterium]|nr:PAS domain S-box protein [Bacteroidota bacterium]
RLTKILPGIESDDANWIGKYGKTAITGKELQFEQASELLDTFYTVNAYQPKQGLCAVLFFDITDRILAEKELAKIKKLLSETEKIGKIGGWTIDMATMKQTWTEETYHIHEVELNFDPDVSKGINFYTPSSRPIIEEAFNHTIETGEPFDLELEIITAKGNMRYVHSVGEAHQLDGVTMSVSGSFQDITARKTADEEVNKTNSLLNSVINSPDNIIMFALDNNYRYLSFNTAHEIEMKNLYEVDIEKGQGILQYKRNEDDRQKAETNYKRVLKGERFIEVQEYGSGDERFWYEMIFNPIFDESSIVIGFTVFVTNITDRKLAEEELIKHRVHLEEMVIERTMDLEEKNTELDEAMKVFVGRELKIRDLQNKINAMSDKDK